MRVDDQTRPPHPPATGSNARPDDRASLDGAPARNAHIGCALRKRAPREGPKEPTEESYRRQKLGENNASNVKSSSRPAIMQNASTSFTGHAKMAKLS